MRQVNGGGSISVTGAPKPLNRLREIWHVRLVYHPTPYAKYGSRRSLVLSQKLSVLFLRFIYRLYTMF